MNVIFSIPMKSNTRLFGDVLLTLCLLLVPVCTRAVVAYPGYIDFKQPDGSIIKVRMMGDDFNHWAETDDGYTLLYDENGYLTLAQYDYKGDLVASNLRITSDGSHNKKLKQAKLNTTKHLSFSNAQKEKAARLRQQAFGGLQTRSILYVNKPQTSVTGKKKFLLILMDFPDKPMTFGKSDFDPFLNKIGYRLNGNNGSVRDYYLENSFGQLDITWDVAGVFRASRGYKYYGDEDSFAAAELLVEGLEKAAAKFDLRDYDNDGDGIIDCVHMIYAGYGEEAGGGSDCIWAHSVSVPVGSGYICKYDGVQVNSYSCSPELMNNSGESMTRIGVLCHEVGHVLGAADFYDTDYGTNGEYPGSGSWDLMGSGNWNGDGGCPAHSNPYIKIYNYHWASPINVTQPGSYSLTAKSANGFIRVDSKTSGEYFLLECRSQSGFDSGVPGHGLMIWRASENLSRSATGKINATHKQQFYPVAANATSAIPTSAPKSYGDPEKDSAPFPGSKHVTSFTDETVPSMKSWSGTATEMPITDITENVASKSVSFQIAGGGQSGDIANQATISASATSNSTIKVTWDCQVSGTRVLLAYNSIGVFPELAQETYRVGDKLSDEESVVLYVGNSTTYIHSGLTKNSNCQYCLYLWNEQSKKWNKSAACQATTTNIDIGNITGGDIYPTSIRITWDLQDKNLVTLLVFNRTGVFPEPERKFGYSPGEKMSDGVTEVLNMGVTDYFVHSNLEENSEYHYALYAWSDKNQKWEFAESFTYWTCSSSGGGLTVSDKDAVSATLTWSNPDNETMLLLVNQTARFPQLQDQYYGIGYLMDDGCTTPIYMGTGNTFHHVGLVNGSTYHYQLCKWHQKSKKWLLVDMTTLTTDLKTAGKIVFQENFDVATFPKGWSQELLRGYYDAWQVLTPYNYMTSTQMVFNGGTQYKYLEGRLILPVLNLQKEPNAVLEFDYRSAVNRVEVQYRTAPDEKWVTIKSMPKTYDGPPSIDVADTQTHMSVILPNLSDTYQIAFLAEFSQESAINYSVYNIATIDNLVVYCDLDFYIETTKPVAVGNDWVSIPCNVSDHNGIVVERGISLSEDSETWQNIILENPEEENVCDIECLEMSSRYYYRTYAKTATETYYGDIMSFETLPFTNGHGRVTDPFLIANDEEWTAFAEYVSSGHDCLGQTFSLTSDILDAVVITGDFQGTLEGNDMTVSSASGIMWTGGLFDTLGKSGTIHGLVAATGSLVSKNYGKISDCKVIAGNSDLHLNGTFGFIANSNYAEILSCSVVIGRTFADGTVGGVCGHNEGHIVGCTFNGTINSGGGCAGGIAAENCNADNKKARQTSILRSKSLGKIEVGDYVNSAVNIGGICGNNGGLIYGCVNEADIISNSTEGDGHFTIRLGGICGYSDQYDAQISYCVNNGDVIMSSNMDVIAGGLAGETQYGFLNNSVSTAVVSSLNGHKLVHDLVGNLILTEYDHLYYKESVGDNIGHLISQEQDWNEMTEVYNIVNDSVVAYVAPVEIVDDKDIILHGIALGNDVVTCALEWKSADIADAKWTRVFQHTGEWMSVDITSVEPGALYFYRTVAVDVAGQSHYSEQRVFATSFPELGTTEQPILINGLHDFEVMRQLAIQGVTFKDKVLKITSDIDLGGGIGKIWEPIYKSPDIAFEGTLDGGGHILNNMYIVSSAPAVGLIGYAGFCKIRSMYVCNAYVYSLAIERDGFSCGAAGIIGSFIPGIKSSENLFIPVEECAVSGEICGTNSMGGITGGYEIPEGTCINSCFVRANIVHLGRDNVHIGGLMVCGAPRYSYFSGSLTAPNAENPHIDAISTRIIITGSSFNTFYEANSEGLTSSSSYANKLTSTEMKDGKLYRTLATSGKWDEDNRDNPMNDGYPVIKSIWGNRSGDDFNWHHVELGDVNDDGHINIGDYVTLVNYILKEPCERFTAQVADLNFDTQIDAGDCVAVMNYILHGSFSSGHHVDYSLAYKNGNVVLPADGFELHCNESRQIDVCIGNALQNFSAFQLDFEMPEVVHLEHISMPDEFMLGCDHKLSVREIEPGTWRIVCLSPTNSDFVSMSGNFLQLSVRADGNARPSDNVISMKGIKFVDSNANVTRVGDSNIPVSILGTSSIDVNETYYNSQDVYSLEGFALENEASYRGIIVNQGKKYIAE